MTSEETVSEFLNNKLYTKAASPKRNSPLPRFQPATRLRLPGFLAPDGPQDLGYGPKPTMEPGKGALDRWGWLLNPVSDLGCAITCCGRVFLVRLTDWSRLKTGRVSIPPGMPSGTPARLFLKRPRDLFYGQTGLIKYGEKTEGGIWSPKILGLWKAGAPPARNGVATLGLHEVPALDCARSP
jgi:hypothetical protein